MKAANLLFVGFLKNENSLESFSLILENSSPKARNMKKSDGSVLEANSRYLESLFLKGKLQILQNMVVKIRLPWKRQC